MQETFKESQKFTQWWLWSILIIVIVLISFSVFKVNPASSVDQQSIYEKMIPLYILAAVVIMFFVARLKTEINQKEIKIVFLPFTKKVVQWKDVKTAELVNYGFVGGWGIRLWTDYGTVYNVQGTKGLAIEMNSGKKFLIGTQKENELKKFLLQMKSK